MLLRQFLGPAHHAGAAFGGGREDDLGAVGAHQFAPFDRERIGHHRDELVARAQTISSATPVLPEVASMIVSPGEQALALGVGTMAMARRSLTEPPG